MLSDYHENRKLAKAVGFLLILSLLLRLYHIYCWRGWILAPDSWAVTEWLINFEGGFVRRGLLGELLLKAVSALEVSPLTVIIGVSILAYVATFYIYAKMSCGKGMLSLLVISPLVLGEVWYIFGRDFMLFMSVAGLVAMARHNGCRMICQVGIVLLITLSIFIHEAFIFWGVPLLILYLYRVKGERVFSAVVALIAIAEFAVMSMFHGDASTAQDIHNSWIPFMPADFGAIPSGGIGAIGWDTKGAFLFHLRSNFGACEGFPVIGLFVRPFMFVVIYYIVVNVVGYSFKDSKKMGTLAGALMLLTTVCLLPMFTVLCCDYSRLYQFALVPTVAFISLVNGAELRKMVPSRMLSGVATLNLRMNRLVVPSVGLILLLLLTMAEAHSLFNPVKGFENSAVGEILFTLSNLMSK
jgi:hypothetical protein